MPESAADNQSPSKVDYDEGILDKKVSKGLYAMLADLFNILANPDRLRILAFLNPNNHSFTEIMFEIGKNPAIIDRHLTKLKEFGLIKKREDGTYIATPEGSLALGATIKDIAVIVQQALQINKHGKETDAENPKNA